MKPETDFGNIQRILRKLSPKQLMIVRAMVNDLVSTNEEAEQKRRSKHRTPNASEHNTLAFKGAGWTSDTGRFKDSEIISAMNHGLPLLPDNSQQLERIMGMGNGHTLSLLEAHLDDIGNKHGVFDHDELYDDGEF